MSRDDLLLATLRRLVEDVGEVKVQLGQHEVILKDLSKRQCPSPGACKPLEIRVSEIESQHSEQRGAAKVLNLLWISLSAVITAFVIKIFKL